ncbi:unnamed protein product [Pseudo-nitzschia multistriata]|uniref:Uncharacterized protein n=1 Tax=Pseudo-nitzschia multistriata TaxID=183589 RepID=A0A448Z464_9STRA|nr:unnamed protein product [Pseudo-nitzschia multistriata]
MSSSSWLYPDDESHIVSAGKPLHMLNPNQFYKICPKSVFDDEGDGSTSSDDPICGDGSPFCFYFSKPSQKSANKDRLLIELMGGGACWDSDTCKMQQEMLYLDEQFDNVLGRSCKEVQYGMQQDRTEANMLCSNQFDDRVNFAQYNTIIVPYCTQDVHLGSKTLVYTEDTDDDDGNNGESQTVHHKGANNLRFVTNWVFKNFPGLRYAAVTGCSAGGTAVPVVEAILHRHYNHFGNRATQVSSIADSPVYLTPSYFLKNALSNWDPQPILSSIGVPYGKYRSSEDYPTLVWDYILRKGSNRNRWGFVSHTEDPVSLTYYQYMSGNGDGDDDNKNYDDDAYHYDDDLNEKNSGNQWYDELSESVAYIKKKHRNVKSYWMDSEGHCSFGLYYALQDQDFPEFAASIVREDPLVLSARPAARSFFLAATTGSCLLAYLVFHRIRRQSSLQPSEDEDGETDGFSAMDKDGIWIQTPPSAMSDDNESIRTKKYRTVRRRLSALLVALEDYPVTSGYTLCITVYLLAMLIKEGFAHPINNPSLGPSAVGLSIFGINNPSLIVYYHQWFRLFTSNFLVSGLLTFGLAMFYLWFRIRKLEQRMISDFKSPWLFVTVIIILATIINAAYCLVPPRRGASTAAIPLLIGLQTFHLTFYWNSFVRPYLSIGAVLFDFIVVVTLFPFNSWVMIVAAVVTGWILAKMARTFDIWLPGPMMNVLKQSGINMEMGSTVKSAREAGNHQISFGTALNFPSAAASESEYSNFDGHVNNSSRYETVDEQRSTCPDHNRSRRWKFVRRTVVCSLLALFVLILVPLFVTLVAKPNALYAEPFYTGCKSFYTSDIDELAASFSLSGSDDDNNQNEEGGRRSLVIATAKETSQFFVRWLAGEGDENKDGDGYGCAEFCVPHLVVPIFQTVLRKKKIPIAKGRCLDNGYSNHIIDKTFSALSYSLDVELYGASGGYDDDSDNDDMM